MRIRAWNSKSKKMFSPEGMAHDQMALLPTGQFANISSVSQKMSVIYSVDVMIPMLSSGLNDKKGQEIFEGDVLDFRGHKFNVLISKGVFCTTEDLHHYPLHEQYPESNAKVIGNIYENPELMKDEKLELIKVTAKKIEQAAIQTALRHAHIHKDKE